jgi:Flp pilus assembly pilin Flp
VTPIDHETDAAQGWRLATLLASGRHRMAGQSMVEYALILVLVAIAVIIVLLTIGKTVKGVFSNITVVLGS